MSFRQRWILWIKACIFSSSLSIMVNEIPMAEFKVSIVIRQRDPLVPFLVLIVVDEGA